MENTELELMQYLQGISGKVAGSEQDQNTFFKEKYINKVPLKDGKTKKIFPDWLFSWPQICQVISPGNQYLLMAASQLSN